MTCIRLRSLQNMAQHLGVMEHTRAAPDRSIGIYDVDLNIDIDMIVYGQRRFTWVFIASLHVLWWWFQLNMLIISVWWKIVDIVLGVRVQWFGLISSVSFQWNVAIDGLIMLNFYIVQTEWQFTILYCAEIMDKSLWILMRTLHE